MKYVTVLLYTTEIFYYKIARRFLCPVEERLIPAYRAHGLRSKLTVLSLIFFKNFRVTCHFLSFSLKHFSDAQTFIELFQNSILQIILNFFSGMKKKFTFCSFSVVDFFQISVFGVNEKLLTAFVNKMTPLCSVSGYGPGFTFIETTLIKERANQLSAFCA